MDLPDELRPYLDRVNRLAATQATLPSKLEAVAEVLKRTVPGCDAVSIALVVEEAAVTGAVSSQLAVEVDLVQYAHDEGPCLTSMAERSPVRIDVLRQDERFEHFAPGAIEVGVESSLSVPVIWGGTVVGSLNLYSTEPNAFTDATLTRVAPIADYAAEVIGGSPLHAASMDLVEGLVTTVKDNDDIQIAIGFLIGAGTVTPAEAWAILRDRALKTGTSVAETARQVAGGTPSDRRSDPDA
jgi:transcriptional regulator with GAF, ATPase, and Fis domain